MQTVTVALDKKQLARLVDALERAWEVLHYGYGDMPSNGWDGVRRNHNKDRAAARRIDAFLNETGWGTDETPPE